MQVAQHCLSAGEEDVAVQAFSIFTDLIEQPAPVLGPLLPGLAAFAMDTALSTHYDLNTREQALQVGSAHMKRGSRLTTSWLDSQ